MAKTVVTSFISQFIASIKGDDAQAKAEKNWRRANSALKSAIPSAEGDSIQFEDAVDSAKENLNKALINNGEDITDSKRYVENILRATEALEEAKENVELHKKKLSILNDALKALSEEVSIEA
jgi:hypothetical protein